MINKHIQDFINHKDAIIFTQFSKEPGAEGVIGAVLIRHGEAKREVDELLLASIGIYGDEAKQILSLTKEEVELYKKVARMKQIKKELETLEQEIAN